MPDFRTRICVVLISFVFLMDNFPCAEVLGNLCGSILPSLFRKMTFGRVSDLGQFIRESEPEPDVKKSKGLLSVSVNSHRTFPYFSQDDSWLFPALFRAKQKCLVNCPVLRQSPSPAMFFSQVLLLSSSWEYEQPVGAGALHGTWQGWKPLAAELIRPSKVWFQNEKEPQLTTCFPSTLGSAVNSAFPLCFLGKRNDLDLLPREPWLPLFPCLSCLSCVLWHSSAGHSEM